MKRVLEGLRTACSKYEYITVEGSGGILGPLCFDEGLGTINDVVLTAFYMKYQRHKDDTTRKGF